MKGYLNPILALATTTLLATGNVQADTEEKMIIALKTDGFEMAETDISSLAIGESQIIETDSGKVIDLLRTADGVEIYVDGELLEMGFDSDDGENIIIRKEIELNCTSDEEGADCIDKMKWVYEGDDINLEDLHEEHMNGEGHKVIIIKKHVVTED